MLFLVTYYFLQRISSFCFFFLGFPDVNNSLEVSKTKH